MIELKNFNFKYGKNQVLNIDEVKIPKNEIIAVIGKNGACLLYTSCNMFIGSICLYMGCGQCPIGGCP